MCRNNMTVGPGRRRAAIAILVSLWTVSLSASCSLQTHAQKREQAEMRWKDVRAGIKFQLARQQYQQGQIDAALNSVGEAIALNPASAAQYHLLAQCHIEQGRLIAAREAIERAVQCGLAPAEASYAYGLLAEADRDLETAATYYRSAREQDGGSLDYLIAEAECLVALGRHDEAAALVEAHRGKFDSAASLEMLRAEIALVMGDKDRALESLRAAAQVLGDDDRVMEELGRALAATARPQEAVAVLLPLVRKHGDAASPSSIAALSASLLAAGSASEAKTWSRILVQRYPDDPRGWTLLARAALVTEDWATARRCADHVERLTPGGSLPHLLRGYVCWKEGDLAGARAALQIALAADQEDDLAQDLMRRVAPTSDEVARLGDASVPNS